MRRDCAVCGSSDREVLFEQVFAELGPVVGYPVAVCQRCGFAFAGDVPTVEVLGQYYREMGKYGDELSERGKANQRKVARMLLDGWIRPGDRVLEIGCATGYLLSCLRPSCPDVSGLDLSGACAAAAQWLYGVHVTVGDACDLVAADGRKYDRVLLLGVLEHLPDLPRALGAIRRSLSRGGMAYVCVPDCENFFAHVDSPYQEFSPEHVNFFSAASLANLMAAHGFAGLGPISRDVLDVTATGKVPVIGGFFAKVAGWQEGAANKHPLKRDSVSGAYLRRYVELSAVREAEIGWRLPADGQFVVWGTGALALRLLAVGILPIGRVAAFVDSNSNYHGRTLCGAPILAPEALPLLPFPIVVCSPVHRQEIKEQIEGMGIHHHVIFL